MIAKSVLFVMGFFFQSLEKMTMKRKWEWLGIEKENDRKNKIESTRSWLKIRNVTRRNAWKY